MTLATTASTQLSIGFGVTGWNDDAWFTGLVDDVRIYNRALNAAEMASLAATVPVVSPSPAAAPVVSSGIMGLDFCSDVRFAGRQVLSAGDNHICALSAGGGAAVCWGDNADGQTKVPAAAAAGGQVAIAANDRNTCVLSEGGAVECWGNNFFDQTDVPAAAAGGGQLAISARGYRICALSEGGAVRCWGLPMNVPAAAAAGGQIAIAVGRAHACTLSAVGDVRCWGSNAYGQSQVPPDIYNWRLYGSAVQVAIAAGGDHSCALSELGVVDCWGDNWDGQTNVPSAALGGGQIAITAGTRHSCSVSAGGAVRCWGYNNVGQCTVPGAAATGGQVAIAAGNFFTCALSAGGYVGCWGRMSGGGGRVIAMPCLLSTIVLPESQTKTRTASETPTNTCTASTSPTMSLTNTRTASESPTMSLGASPSSSSSTSITPSGTASSSMSLGACAPYPASVVALHGTSGSVSGSLAGASSILRDTTCSGLSLPSTRSHVLYSLSLGVDAGLFASLPPSTELGSGGVLTATTCSGTNFDTLLFMIGGCWANVATRSCSGNDDFCGAASSVTVPLTSAPNSQWFFGSALTLLVAPYDAGGAYGLAWSWMPPATPPPPPVLDLNLGGSGGGGAPAPTSVTVAAPATMPGAAPFASGIFWPGNVASTPSGQLAVAGWTLETGHELFTQPPGGAWAVIDAVPGSSGSAPQYLISAYGYFFYSATDAAAIWVSLGSSARAVAVSAEISHTVGSALAYNSALLVAAGTPATLLSVAIVPDMASSSAAPSAVTDVLAGTGVTDVSAPRLCGSSLFFYGTLAGDRWLLHVSAVGAAPVAVGAPVQASGAPQCVASGVAYISAYGSVRVYDPVSATIADAAPSLVYDSATALTWASAGLCFSAVTSAGANPEIVCAGVLSGDLTVVTRSSAAGVSLGAGATYFAAKGRVVYTGCNIVDFGGPHLCAFDGVSGALVASSWIDAANLRVTYNAFGVVGSRLVFAAAAGSGATSLWALDL